MLPPTIPLFPLPNVVLFPNVFLPLHVFEPRYRAMIGDALDGDRIVGMVLLQPGYEADYEGRPPVFPIGCAGLITRAEPLGDGRYNVILRGLERFRIEREDTDRPYRVAHVSGSARAHPGRPPRRTPPISPPDRGTAGRSHRANRRPAEIPPSRARRGPRQRAGTTPGAWTPSNVRHSSSARACSTDAAG